MIKYITSVNGTHHIGLYNYRNAYCHYIAVLQRLHSSPNLNEQLLKFQNTDDITAKISLTDDQKKLISTIMYPVHLYATFDPSKSNGLSIYESIKQYFESYENDYIIDRAKHGYIPQYVMCFIFLPVICKIFPDKFELILRQLNMDVIDFINGEAAADDVILGSQCFFKNATDRQFMRELYKDMLDNHLPQEIIRDQFCATVLDVFPNRNDTGGHAVALIKCDRNKYVIIDDQNRISPMEDYYRERKSRIYRISVRDIDEKTVANINAILHAECDIEPANGYDKRISRYELNFDHKFKVVNETLMLRDEFKSDTVEYNMRESYGVGNTKSLGISGGGGECTSALCIWWNKWKNIIIIIMFIMMLMMIISQSATIARLSKTNQLDIADV